jgi:hypothetical protein
MPLNFKQLFFPSPSNWKYWVFVAFFIRSLFFFVQIHVFHGGSFWGIEVNDTYSYLTPIDNLVDKGIFSPDFRMPGYGMVYLPLRYLFSRTVACNILLLVQLLFSALSIYPLALIAQRLLKHVLFFYATFFLYAISYYTCCFDQLLLTESFSCSFLILSLFYFIRYFDQKKKRDIVISSFFMVFLIFMRPVFLPLLIIFPGILFLSTGKSWKNILTTALLFAAPFVLADGLWMIYNYKHYEKIVPLTRTKWSPNIDSSYVKPCNEFIESYGGGYVRDDGMLHRIPAYAYTSKFNEDSIAIIRSLITMSIDPKLSLDERDKYLKILTTKLDAYSQSIRNEKPYVYYIKAPFNNVSRLMDFSSQMCILFFVKKYGGYMHSFYGYLYLLTIYSGFWGMCLLFAKSIKDPLLLFIPTIPFYTIFVHSFVVRATENRYIIPSYPFIIICGIFLFFWIFTKVKSIAKSSQKA